MRKIALVLQSPADTLGARAAWMGEAVVYAVNLERRDGQDRSCFAYQSVAPAARHHPESLRAAALAALDELRKKMVGADEIPGDAPEVHAFVAYEDAFRDFCFENKHLIFIPPGTRQPDLDRATAMTATHFQTRQQMLRLEFPQLPWDSDDLSLHLAALAQGGAEQVYDVTHPELAAHWHHLKRRKKILLHVCCGPDAAGVINQLQRDFEVVCFWYDPNIQPREEYDLRLDAFKKVSELEQTPYIIGEYDVDRFFELIKGLEHTPEQGAKCSLCYDMRLERSAIEAKRQGCDLFTTTLAISPHKVQQKLKNFGEQSAARHGLRYFTRNFMKDDGFKRSVEYTRDYGIYRQDYCGCLYSLHEGGPQARALAETLGVTAAQLAEQKKRKPFTAKGDPQHDNSTQEHDR